METALRCALWLLLGGWIGAWTLFATTVAPVAFTRLPSPDLAAEVVGPVLAVLHRYGIVAGVALALLAALGRRGALRVVLPLVLALACAVSEFGITPAIHAVRAHAFGPAADAAAAARFARLHRASTALYTAVGVGALVLAVLHARTDAAGRGRAAEPAKPA